MVGSVDLTYNFSKIGLWNYAEVTCGHLVLCVPVVPKALRKLNPSFLVSSVRSWSLGSLRRLRRPSNKLDGSTAWSQKSRSTVYRQVEDPEIPLTKVESAYQTNGATGSTNSFPRKDSDVQSGIVRTTRFTTAEKYSPNGSTQDHIMDSQHPWAEAKLRDDRRNPPV
jgi:hypothetical protein